MTDQGCRRTNSESDAAAGPDVLPEDRAELTALNRKINEMLPLQYQNCYAAVQPVSMGSAGLKFAPDGKVAWDEIWTTFCDLALAGGPPHRGTLLAPASSEDVFAAPELYQAVVEEIGRGIWMTTGLPVLPHIAPGWVGVRCSSEEMAAWLVRAVTVENVTAQREREMLYLPAGPQFRLGKEAKNVVVALAKTCHYWTDHMPARERTWAAAMSYAPSSDTTLLGPVSPEEARARPDGYRAVVEEVERGIREATALPVVPQQYPGWVGVQCRDEEMAVWLMRALIVENVLAHAEGPVLYLPVSFEGVGKKSTIDVVHQLSRLLRLFHAHVAVRESAKR